jgi:hypothetical protein
VIAGVDQGGDREPAASGLSREDDVRWGRAVVQEGFVGRQSVVDRCRIRMLRGEPVVDGDDLGAIPSTVISAVGTPPSAAAVTVTSAGSGCADINSRSCRRCSLTSLPAGKADCRRIASRFSRCSVLTEGSPLGWNSPGSTPSGLTHVIRC